MVIKALKRLNLLQRLPTMVVIDDGSRIVDANEASKRGASKEVNILARERCAGPKLFVEATKFAHHLPPRRHVCAVNEPGGEKCARRERTMDSAWLNGHRIVIRVKQQDPPT